MFIILSMKSIFCLTRYSKHHVSAPAPEVLQGTCNACDRAATCQLEAARVFSIWKPKLGKIQYIQWGKNPHHKSIQSLKILKSNH